MVEKLLNRAELAELLHVSPNTILKWRFFGDGPPAILVGQNLRWKPSQVNAWLEEQALAAKRPKRSKR